MTAYVLNEVRQGFYLDSVALMRTSRAVADIEDVEEAALMMGTPSNKEIMRSAGLLDEAGERAGGGDLIVGIRARSKEKAKAALASARQLLEKPSGGQGANATGQWQPLTLRTAMTTGQDHHLVLISVAGDFAVAEARKAIHAGRHVMIFSDNVPLEEEVALKQEANELGCLVMGPDCGTAIINGTALAFANKVRRGNIGIVGASGTGIQEVTCLIDRGGKGVSHAIGVGGRDLKEEVGGISTLMAMQALEQDEGTDHIVLISKPPSDSVAKEVLETVGRSKKPYTICFIGAKELEVPDNATFAPTLRAAAISAVGSDAFLQRSDFAGSKHRLSPDRNLIRGLYSGGTLCAEAQVLLDAAGVTCASNAPIPGVSKLDQNRGGHTIIDLGNDEFTRGKPHPMIDPSVRFEVLQEALSAADVGVILLDVVIGFGAHEDPAGQLIEQVDSQDAGRPILVVSVTGTDEDPQIRSRQVQKLERAGFVVAPSNADAVEFALSCIGVEFGAVRHAAG